MSVMAKKLHVAQQIQMVQESIRIARACHVAGCRVHDNTTMIAQHRRDLADYLAREDIKAIISAPNEPDTSRETKTMVVCEPWPNEADLSLLANAVSWEKA